MLTAEQLAEMGWYAPLGARITKMTSYADVLAHIADQDSRIARLTAIVDRYCPEPGDNIDCACSSCGEQMVTAQGAPYPERVCAECRNMEHQ